MQLARVAHHSRRHPTFDRSPCRNSAALLGVDLRKRGPADARVQRLISHLKQKELDRMVAAISGDRSALAGSRLAAQAETLSLADLLAYRDTITSVREWPARAPTILRVLLLLMIPIVGWIGGALVERVIGSLLD